ncbi:MAG: Non-motile and phage-resistance protein [Parcubacteria group bacterium ADurb.Bin316]|nr:MAG: Non-motile and phage-resistance protein [Parcubacteria group bacterium ADurb.Bin316]HOZ56031.1 ATP-binding protein [bacterium]
MLDSINTILLFVIVVYFIAAFLFYKKGPGKIVVFSYLYVIFCAALWTLAMMIYRASSPENSLFWCTILYIIAVLPSSSVYFFSIVFPRGNLPSFRNNFWTIFVSLIVVSLVTMPDIIIRRVDVFPGREKVIIWGNYYFIYFVYISGIISYGLLNLFKKYLRESGLVKIQLSYIFWGYFVGSGLAMFPNLLLPWIGIFKINWMGQVLGMITIAITVFAIIKHRLMDIKFVMRQYLVLLLSFAVVVIPSVLVIRFYEDVVPQYKVWVDLMILFLAVYFFPVCQKFFYKFANKYLFSSLYDSAQVIAKLSDKLRSTLYLEKVYEYIFESLNNAFHLKAFGIMSFDEKKGTYYVRYNKGFEIGSLTEYEAVPALEKMFIKQNKPIVVDEIKVDNHDSKAKKLLNFLKKTGVAILMPLNVKDKTVGLLALGEKESGDIFNSEDYKVLDVVSAQSAIAIENAMLYDESQKFTIKLEKEVEKATKELKDANEKLKKLDESKSEFISIASHQLRTPLTVVKGYVSMILEGSFGKISATQRDSLDKVYQSNERLIHLVENLLNLSRIESGRLQFKYETMNLETVVDSVFEELTSKAKEKKLKFEYKKPAKPLPKVVIDQEKIRQVIMNLIDNSIKYTAKGSVTVSVKKEADNIEFCVSDTGMGVDPDDIPHLFQKFQRGTGTFLVHTEGTGLGLYVAREMIEQHKGKIWVESKGKNKGSKFIFTIPINNV